MPARNDTIRDRLSRYREINITVTGRKSGRTISIPVWSVLEDDKLYLLPVQGSDTQWYKNVLKKPSIRIDADGAVAELKVVPVTDAKQVSSVVEKFRAKYGTNDVKKYYSPILVVHICGGTLGLLSGTAAMSFRKGSPRHVQAGKVFVASMLTMAVFAVYLAIKRHQPNNIGGGILTFYLIGTAWLTARRRDGETSRLDWVALL